MASRGESNEVKYLKDRISSTKRRLEADNLSDYVRKELERELRRFEDQLAIQYSSELSCLIGKEAKYLKES